MVERYVRYRLDRSCPACQEIRQSRRGIKMPYPDLILVNTASRKALDRHPHLIVRLPGARLFYESLAS